ncbi:uncharacterized protein LOC122506767 [Leptopilina heterotoma]|uniref:uncharacterized protein LOC122506767 n=1 Tax=Leptopilina heterotoma TaxID=63436 RepID=UPI001CA91B34|nr:uncharacterized protein LOC122506767 [Leptopilina heterotoma]
MKKIENKRSEPAPQESESDKVSDKTESDQVAQYVLSTQKSRKSVLLRVLPVTLKDPSGEINMFAILDGGSTISLINSKIADRLGLKGPVEPLIATWYNNESVKEDHSRLVSVEICGSSGKKYLLQDVQMTNALKLPEQSMKIDPEKWPHFKNLDIPDLDNAIPTIMIGEDNLHLKRIMRQVTGKNGLPYASLTPLGWMVHGPYDVGRVDKTYTFFIQKNEDIEIHDTLKEFWSTESFGVRPSEKILRSKEEQRARDILDQTTRRIGNRWEAGLLWKEVNCELPESRKAAEKRLLSIEQKMKRDPNFGEKYAANMQSYIEKGYARRLTEKEINEDKNKVWYLPHFAAVNPQKPKKLRMFFVAASKSHGESLNDHLLKGPDLLNSLPGILFKFREKKVAIGGDLKEMFHQVRIIKEDRSSQRFLWRDKETKQIDTLEMNVMIFGAVCSPYTAHEVRNRNAQEFQKMYPDACNAVVNKHYMDDYYDSVDTVEEAIQRTKDVIHVHRQGGFEVRNWTSNSEEVLNSLDPSVIAPKGTSLVLTGENYTRVLGVRWSPETDSFLFVIDFPRIDKELFEGAKPPTKRKVLKFLMSLFDPLGLLAIWTIQAKMIMQDILRFGPGWDEELPDDLKEKWFSWLKDIRDAQSLRIPRCYSGDLDRVRDIQLHIFADASTQAMSAVAYFRLEGDSGIRTVLVIAKTRVAPIKILTVPRLELQAVMAVRMAPFISQK